MKCVIAPPLSDRTINPLYDRVSTFHMPKCKIGEASTLPLLIPLLEPYV